MSQTAREKFGARLNMCRRISNKSVPELCEKLRVTDATYYKYEKGQSFPDVEQLHMLCEIYHCDMNKLFGYDTDSSQLSLLAIKAARIIDKLPEDHKIIGIYVLGGLKFQVMARESNEITTKQVDDALRRIAYD